MSWFGGTATLGECPRWDGDTQSLTWVDIDGGTLHRAVLVDGAWGDTQWSVGAPLAGAVAVDGAADTYVLSLGGDLVTWHPASGAGEALSVLAPDQGERLRLNETVTDPWGRIWVGSMAYDWTAGAGSFSVRHRDGLIARVIEGCTITNGVGWSPDGTQMYTTETRPGAITAWRVDEHGMPTDPRVVVTSDGTDGNPDGLAVDTEGNLWSAFAGGGHVTCHSPQGRVLHRVGVDAPLATSCCFAGPERDRLVVTTGTKRLDAETLRRHPSSGRVFDAGVVGATGLPQRPAAPTSPPAT